MIIKYAIGMIIHDNTYHTIPCHEVMQALRNWSLILRSVELSKGVFDKLELKNDRYAKSKWLNNGHIRVNSRRGKAKPDASTSPGNLVMNDELYVEGAATSIIDGDINVEAIEFTTRHGASIYEVNAESELLKGPIGDEGDSGEEGEPGATIINIFIS
jgi:hypothetical protein